MTTGIGSARPPAPLNGARNATLTLAAMAPWITKYADQYGVPPELVAAIIRQESSFINHRVHRDGTGHGLVGLDDNGLLPDFERWSGIRVGRGHRANTIAPEKQIEFLAMTLASLTERCGGNEWEAVRAWHGGMGGRNRRYALQYEQLIRGHIPSVLHAVVGTGAKPPELVASASTFGSPVGAPQGVRLGAEAGTPVRGSIDFEDT